MTDLQRASFGKRIIATIFDGILAVIVAVALAFCLSAATGYDKYMDTVNDAKIRYAAEYGIKADITTQELGELSEEQIAQYNAANEALAKDPDVIYAYNMMISLRQEAPLLRKSRYHRAYGHPENAAWSRTFFLGSL